MVLEPKIDYSCFSTEDLSLPVEDYLTLLVEEGIIDIKDKKELGVLTNPKVYKNVGHPELHYKVVE